MVNAFEMARNSEFPHRSSFNLFKLNLKRMLKEWRMLPCSKPVGRMSSVKESILAYICEKKGERVRFC